MVARICEVLALDGLGARARRRHRLRLPGRRARRARRRGGDDRADPGARRSRRSAPWRRAGYENVEVRVGDGTLGVPDRAPFEAIAVAAAAPGYPGHALRAARARRADGDSRSAAGARRICCSSSGARKAPRSSAPSPAGSSRCSARRASTETGARPRPRSGAGRRLPLPGACARRSRSGSPASSATCPDGSVEAAFEGDDDLVESMVDWCRHGPRGARVDDVEVSWEQPTGEQGFAVR